MPYNRSLGEVFDSHSDQIKDEIRKVLPGTVTAVYAAKQTVDVQIAIKNPLFDEYNNVKYEAQISLSDVPCGVMRGGGFFVWMPIAVGDSVLVVFSDLSCDVWRMGGNTPGWLGKHTADSPFAIPCIGPDAKAFVDVAAAAGKLIIGKDGSAAQIRLSATDIELGNLATDHVGLASLIDAAVSTIVTAFNAHTHNVTAVGSPTGPAIPLITPSPPSVASTLIKAQ